MKGQATNLKDIDKIKYSARKNAPTLQRHWDALQPGLILAVRSAPGDKRQTGRKVWQVRCDVTRDGVKKQSIIKIGEFPAMGLVQARAKAAELRDAAEQGTDVKKQARSAGVGTTLDTLFDEITRPPKQGQGVRYPMQESSPRYRYTMERNYAKHIQPVLGHIAIGKITDDHWRDIIDNLRYDQNKRGAASNVLALCNVIYKNLRKGHPDKSIRKIHNPLAGDDKPDIGKFTRDRHFTVDELADLWLDFSDNEIHQAITRVLILSGQRISEVLRMRWDDMESGEWVVGKKGTMKNKASAHHLPLTPALLKAIEPMREYGSEWVFKGNVGKHLSPGAYYSAIQNYIKRTGCEKFSAHVFRHSFMTLKSNAGVEYLDAEFVVHHSIKSTGAVYDHSQHLMEKERALTLWADYLQEQGIVV